MNRRDLLKYLLATPLAATVDYEKLLWTPKVQIVVPTVKEVSLFGISYHQSNASTERWLGFERAYQKDDIFFKMIRGNK